MAINRTLKLKTFLDNGLKLITKRSNFCRSRVYEEFDLTPIYLAANAARARGMAKWKNATGHIKELISSS